MRLLKGFTDQELVEGGEPAQRKAREELRKQQLVRLATSSNLDEIPKADICPGRFGLLEADGVLFRVVAVHPDVGIGAATAFFRDGDSVTFLEPGPR